MKKVLWKRILPFLMAAIMLCSACLSTAALAVSAPSEEEPIWTVTLEDGVLRVRLNAERLYAVLEDKQLTKEELKLLLPEALTDAIDGGGLSADSILPMLTEHLSADDLTELLAMLPTDLLLQYFPFEALEGVLTVEEMVSLLDIDALLSSATAEELGALLNADTLELLLHNEDAKKAIFGAVSADMIDIEGLLASDTDGSLRRALAELIDSEVVEELLTANPNAQATLQALAESGVMRDRVLGTPAAVTGLKNYFRKPEHDTQVNDFVHNETVERELYESQAVHDFIDTHVEVQTALNKVLTEQGLVDPVKVPEAKWNGWLDALHVDIDADFVSTHRAELFGTDLTDSELGQLVNGKTEYQLVCEGTVKLAKIVEIYNREHSDTPITVKSMIDAGFFTNKDIADLMHDNWEQMLATDGLIEVILGAVDIPLILEYFPIAQLVGEALGGYVGMWELGLLTEEEILDAVGGYDALLNALLPEKAERIVEIVGYEALAEHLDYAKLFAALGGYGELFSYYSMPELAKIIKSVAGKELVSFLRGLDFEKKAYLTELVSELRALISARKAQAKPFLKAVLNSTMTMLTEQIPLMELNDRKIFKYGTFDLNAFVTELLLSLPDIEEFLAMDDANRTLLELTLTAHIGGETLAEATETLTLGIVVELTGELAPLQGLVAEYSDYFDITITETAGEPLDVIVDVIAPEKLSALYSKAFESDKLPEEAKRKLLELPTMTVAELADWLEGLSPEQLALWADALEDALPDSVAGKLPEQATDKVNELTGAEKLALIRDKVLTVIRKAEGVAADRTLAELYEENGAFTYTREPIDLYEKLSKFIADEALLEKLYLFFDNNMLLNVNGTVNITLNGVYELTVTDENGAARTYLLPEGFALKHLNTYGGLSLDILDGATMPAEDTALCWLYLYDGYENGEYGNLTHKIPYFKGQYDAGLLPDLPAQEGTTEGRWILSGTPDGDEAIVKAHPVYDELYYVEFYTDTDRNGVWELYKTLDYVKGTTAVVTPAVPQRAHYTAVWEEYESRLNTQKTVKVYAEYTAKEYTISYYIDGQPVSGGYTATYTVEDTYADLTVPTMPAKDGYDAPKWVYADGAAKKLWSSYDFSQGGDVVVTADYGTPIQYIATFKLNGQELGTAAFDVFDIQNGAFLDQSKLPQIPDKPHYHTPEWTYTLTYGHVTIEAVYVPIDYEITYIVDGAVYSHSGSATYNVETQKGMLTIPAVPQKTGYTAEWVWMDGEEAKPWSEYDFTRGGQLRVLALYSPIDYEAAFKVNGVTVDTVIFTIDDVNAGRLPRVPDVPAKKGYTGAWETYTLSCRSFSVEAVYTIITYTATFIADGEVVGTVDFTVEDDAIEEPPVPEKDGYTGAWESYVLDAEDLEIHAVYTPIGGGDTPGGTPGGTTPGTSTDTEEPDGQKPGVDRPDDGGDDDDEGGFGWIWWLILILILIIAILLTIILVMRNMHNDDDDDDTPPPAPVVVPEPEPEPEPIVIVDDVDVETADALMSDETAMSVIETVGGAGVGMKVIINVHDLEARFRAGDTVDLAALKAMKLVPAKGQRLKVLADGHLSKPLTVIAESFSVQAVKMITLTGGKVIQKK